MNQVKRWGIVILVFCVMSGCQKLYTYRMSGVVRSATDGSPIPNARVEVSGEWTFALEPTHTGIDGTFMIEGEVSDSAFRVGYPAWSLRVSRSGFADEVLDVSPTEQPESSRNPVRIFVVVQMRKGA